jgi:hypothetical protein
MNAEGSGTVLRGRREDGVVKSSHSSTTDEIPTKLEIETNTVDCIWHPTDDRRTTGLCPLRSKQISSILISKSLLRDDD